MLTLAQVAERLQFTERFIREEIYRGRLTAMKAGTAKNAPVRVSEEALAEYIEQRTVRGARS